MTKNVLDELYVSHEILMERISKILRGEKEEEKSKYYNLSTHSYIRRNCWEILLPLDKEEWSKTAAELNLNYEESMPWPNFSTYCYSMDVVCPPNIPFRCLYFGYAVMEDGSVVKTAFYHWYKMVNYQIMPQGIVMDPLADMKGIKPRYYIGCSVDREDIEGFIHSRKINVLERYVERKSKKEHEERLHDSYMEAYYIQMAYEPHYLPQALQEFAKKEDLPFPEDQRGST